MVPITTDMKIGLEYSKFVRITLAILRSPGKPVRKDAWNCQSSLDYSGNLAVTNKTGMKRPWELPKFRISYFGNLMVTITTDTKISLEHSKFLWIILAIFRSPAKLVRKKLLAQPQFL